MLIGDFLENGVCIVSQKMCILLYYANYRGNLVRKSVNL